MPTQTNAVTWYSFSQCFDPVLHGGSAQTLGSGARLEVILRTFISGRSTFNTSWMLRKEYKDNVRSAISAWPARFT